jgi:LAO/AO transport system kinase
VSDDLAVRLADGERRALAQAITLIESARPSDRANAEALLDDLLARTGGAVRIGITGAPGAGKSTFIEAFGLYLIGQGHKVAVLAVDPSSARSGGSILGDKTRMEQLARAKDSFIRPSPSGGALGGVARRTREAMLACEAAGFDVVIVETVGVGQSETAVADMVDIFLLLIQPGAGDELQGIKRGIMELADLVVVNKADGDLLDAAGRAQAEYGAALHLMRPRSPEWSPQVLACSALEDRGIGEIWAAVGAYREALGETEIANRRTGQARAWMWSELRDSLVAGLMADDAVKALAVRLEAEVTAGAFTPGSAARRLLEAFLGDGAPPT